MRPSGWLCLSVGIALALSAGAAPAASDDGAPASGLTAGGTALAPDMNDARKKKQDIGDMWPMLLIPFIIQAVVLPFFLTSLKMMAVKSLFVGKVALLLLLFNVLRNAALQSQDNVYKDNLAEAHYGYNGGPEIGAWFNR
ncbi:uncharacterized protein LOC126298475 [Schistocerca gregaria]|uniref:uncharacterized protein LOC126298475 n=1 Tax=Schistocerca gregaria TaxID=7010 RepID=UPI00211EA360|nr:uncharacterized protein LOC126298475 [Schistocerca gregaria]